MIRLIIGKLKSLNKGYCVILTPGGVGYKVNIPLGSFLYGLELGKEVELYISTQFRQEDISLYGFRNEEELELFELIKDVNGVGGKAALSIISTFAPAEFLKAVANNDVKSIKKANGIGPKIAQRIILELKDKLGSFSFEDDIEFCDVSFETNREIDEALLALMSLGYREEEARKAIGKEKEGLKAEDYIKIALKNM